MIFFITEFWKRPFRICILQPRRVSTTRTLGSRPGQWGLCTRRRSITLWACWRMPMPWQYMPEESLSSPGTSSWPERSGGNVIGTRGLRTGRKWRRVTLSGSHEKWKVFVVSVILWEGEPIRGGRHTGELWTRIQDQWGFIVSVISWEGVTNQGWETHRVNIEQWGFIVSVISWEGVTNQGWETHGWIIVVNKINWNWIYFVSVWEFI